MSCQPSATEPQLGVPQWLVGSGHEKENEKERASDPKKLGVKGRISTQ